MKKQSIIYKVAIGLLVTLFGFGSISNLLKLPEVTESLEKLGYPMYFSTMLGTAQLLGIILLLVPKLRLIKELVFFGFFFNLVAALVSHLVVEGFVPVVGFIVFVLGILAFSFQLFLKLQKSDFR